MAIQRLSVAQIEAQMDQLAQSPQDLGALEYIVLRLPDEQRATPQAVEVSPRWRTRRRSLGTNQIVPIRVPKYP